MLESGVDFQSKIKGMVPMPGKLAIAADYCSTIGELFKLLWVRRLWWLFPIVFMLVILSGLIILGQATPLGPFIYTLF